MSAPLIVEVDMGSASSRGRPPERAWLVRLCRADRCVVVAIGLSRIAAEHLADHIAEIVQVDPAHTHGPEAEPEVTPLA